MPCRNILTEKQIANRYRQKRGCGNGDQYVPWRKTSEFKSKGRISRMLGRTTGRVHHLANDSLRRIFLDLDWQENVCDIREQFPLDRHLTRVLAQSIGRKHPRDRRSGVDRVLTTDFLVDVRRGDQQVSIAVAYQSTSNAGTNRSSAERELERRYWGMLGVEFQLRTDLQCSRQRAESLMFLHEFHDADRWPCAIDGFWQIRTGLFVQMLKEASGHESFIAFAGRFERGGGFSPGEAVSTLRYAATNRMIPFDLEVAFHPSLRLQDFLRPTSIEFGIA